MFNAEVNGDTAVARALGAGALPAVERGGAAEAAAEDLALNPVMSMHAAAAAAPAAAMAGARAAAGTGGPATGVPLTLARDIGAGVVTQSAPMSLRDLLYGAPPPVEAAAVPHKWWTPEEEDIIRHCKSAGLTWDEIRARLPNRRGLPSWRPAGLTEVGRCRLTISNSSLKLPGTKRLKLKYDILLSTSAFKFNLHRYTEGYPMDDNGVGARQGLRLFPISAQLELSCPPCNPTNP